MNNHLKEVGILKFIPRFWVYPWAEKSEIEEWSPGKSKPVTTLGKSLTISGGPAEEAQVLEASV